MSAGPDTHRRPPRAPGAAGTQCPRFAHDSERRFARILDVHEIAWEYEPVEFALEWNQAGRVTAGFRPDFWLPGQRLFVELTTLNQRLVTKKNRKVRRMAELYPEVRVTVLYQRDTLALLAKYGLAGDTLSLPVPVPAG